MSIQRAQSRRITEVAEVYFMSRAVIGTAIAFARDCSETNDIQERSIWLAVVTDLREKLAELTHEFHLKLREIQDDLRLQTGDH